MKRKEKTKKFWLSGLLALVICTGTFAGLTLVQADTGNVLQAGSGASIGHVAVGTQIFTDRTTMPFNAGYPACMEGVEYVYGSIDGNSATALQNGYVYVLTPPAEQANSQENTLIANGFQKINIASWTLSSGISQPIVVYGKYIKTGQTISNTKWGVVLASLEPLMFTSDCGPAENLAQLQPAGSYTLDTIEDGKAVFGDRTYIIGNTPAMFSGMMYIKASLDNGSSATVTAAGYVYVMTPKNAPNGRGADLIAAGYTKTDIISYPLWTTLSEPVEFYKKLVDVNDTVSYGKWGVTLCGSGTPTPSPTATAAPTPSPSPTPAPETELQQPLADVVSASSADFRFRAQTDYMVFRDRAYAFGTLPDYLEGKSYIASSIDNGFTVEVTAAGYVYVATPTTAPNSQISALQTAGFTLFNAASFKISPQVGENVALYGKYMSTGDTLTLGKWAVVFFKELPDEQLDTPPVNGPEVISDPEVILAENSRYRRENREWQGIPGIEKTATNHLWAVWYSGGDSEGSENYAIVAKSLDDGQTWTPVMVVDDYFSRIFDPSLWVDPQGRLWFFFVNGSSASTWVTWGMHTEDPNAAQPVWTDFEKVADGIMLNKPTVLSNGDWLISSYKWSGTGTDTLVYRAVNQGESWVLRGSLRTEVQMWSESMIVEKNDGSLWMLLRTSSGIGQSFSTDGGATWSVMTDTGWGGPNSRFFIRRLASGNLLLINHYNYSGRSNMTAMLSTDDGQTWPYKLLLDGRTNVSYPDGMQDENGVIYAVYDRERGEYITGLENSAKEILMAVFTEEDIMAGSFTSSVAREKVVILDDTPVNNVIKKINALPTVITLGDKAAVLLAKEAYDSLSQTAQGQVTNAGVLSAAYEAILELEETDATTPPASTPPAVTQVPTQGSTPPENTGDSFLSLAGIPLIFALAGIWLLVRKKRLCCQR